MDHGIVKTLVFRNFFKKLWLVFGDFSPGTNSPQSHIILAEISPPFSQGYYKGLSSVLLKSRHFTLFPSYNKLINLSKQKISIVQCFFALGELVLLSRNNLLNILSGVFLGVLIELANLQNPGFLLDSFFDSIFLCLVI